MKPIHLSELTFKDKKSIEYKTEITTVGSEEEVMKDDFFLRRALRNIIPGGFTEDKIKEYKCVKVVFKTFLSNTNK